MLNFPFTSLKKYEKKLKDILQEVQLTENTLDTLPESNNINELFIPGSIFECLKSKLNPTFFQQYEQDAKHIVLYSQFPHLEQPYVKNDDLIYIGQTYEDKAHGFGKLVSKMGNALFEGHFVFGCMHGPGRFIFQKGDIFQGEWFFNKILSGNYYDEKLKLFIKVQELHIEFPPVRSQTNYNGKVIDGLREGFGRYQWEDGTHFIGEFVKNNIQGYGKMKYKDGKIFRGYWDNNQMNGEGQFQWPNGQLYIGNYKNDLKHGKGMLFLKGKTIVSQFEEGRMVQNKDL